MKKITVYLNAGFDQPDFYAFLKRNFSEIEVYKDKIKVYEERGLDFDIALINPLEIKGQKEDDIAYLFEHCKKIVLIGSEIDERNSYVKVPDDKKIGSFFITTDLIPYYCNPYKPLDPTLKKRFEKIFSLQ